MNIVISKVIGRFLERGHIMTNVTYSLYNSWKRVISSVKIFGDDYVVLYEGDNCSEDDSKKEIYNNDKTCLEDLSSSDCDFNDKANSYKLISIKYDLVPV
jgi:hypothetical protein